jgi:hypothetical protein
LLLLETFALDEDSSTSRLEELEDFAEELDPTADELEDFAEELDFPYGSDQDSSLR